MTISAALSIATGGLANINSQLALVSQNVANASTPGYSAEIATQQSLAADGVGLGVRTGPATRDVDAALQAEVFSQNATVAGLQTRQNALAGDRCGAGHAGSRLRYRQPHRRSAKSVLHAAERSEQSGAAKPGGFRRNHSGAGHQHAERCLRHPAPDRAGRYRLRGGDAEQHARQYRRASATTSSNCRRRA